MSDKYVFHTHHFSQPIPIEEARRVREMFSPVRCAHCNGIYDLGKVEVTARYADCSVWNAPCCSRQVDDRGETGWKSLKDYYKIDKRNPPIDPRFPW